MALAASSPSLRPLGRCVAILIGIDAYQNGIPPLRSAVRDVCDVARVLNQDHGYEVRILINEQATLAGLRALLSTLATEFTADVRLIFYFAGHGIAEDADEQGAGPQGFLIPQDGQRDDSSTFLPMVEVSTRLAQLPCRHMLLVLDCCFAGAFRWSQTRSLRVRPATLYRERYDRYLRDAAWQVITSAAADEHALDRIAGGMLGRRSAAEGNSPFAEALCQGLRGDADLRVGGQPGDGIIAANELLVYLESAFERLEQQLKRTLQKPLLWSAAGRDKGQFIFLTPGRSIALPSALELVEKNNPYRGLEPYEEGNAALFFGRKEVVDALHQQVITQPLTIVSGVSGSGKSSVVRAGLLTRLRAATDWQILPIVRPGNRALAALAAIVHELGTDASTELDAEVAAWRTRNSDKLLLLVVDQLEELITLGTAPVEQQQFLVNIRQAIASSAGQLHVVMTLRADFEPHFAELLLPQDGAHVRFLVRPMNHQELRQVIEGPASERVLYFDPPTLVDQLIAEVAEMPGALPLLSFTLSELYRAYVRSARSDRCLSHKDYQKLNGVAGALSQRADEIFQGLDAAHQDTLRRTMLRMVALQGGDMARRRVPRDELSHGPHHPEEARVETVLERLQEARLIVAGRDSEGTPYVEPAHDKLVLGWPRLRQFIDEEKANLYIYFDLGIDAQKWIANRKHQGYLWDADPRLAQALVLLDRSKYFNAVEKEFLLRSRRARRFRQGLVAAIAVSVIAGLSYGLWRTRRDARQLAQSAQEIQRNAQAIEAQNRETQAQLLSTYAEQGRRLLVEKNDPLRALLWLERAHEGLEHDVRLQQAFLQRTPTFRYLLREALRPIDATQAVLLGHSESIKVGAFSPRGDRVVTASLDHTARLWDAHTGKLVAVLNGHQEPLQSAAFSPDGTQVLTTSWDKTARVWDAQTGAQRLVLRGHEGWLSTGVFADDGKRILTVSWDKTARLWESNSGALLHILQGHTDNVICGVFSRDGEQVMTGGRDGTARTWDTQTGKPRLVLKCNEDPVVRVAFSAKGDRLLTAIADHTARLWEAQTGKELAVMRGHRSIIYTARFNLEENVILTASNDGTARMWEAATGKGIAELQGHEAIVYTADFSPNGEQILTAGADGTARLWNAVTGRFSEVLQGHSNSLSMAIFSPDGERVLTTSDDKTARLWNLSRGPLQAVLREHSNTVRSAVFSPDGTRILTASFDNTARLWDARSHKPLATLSEHRSSLNGVTFSADGKRILTWSSDQTARVWDAEGKLIANIKGQPGPIATAAFSPDGERVVTASSDEAVRLWEATTGRQLTILKGHTGFVSVALFSPDGNHILTTSGDSTVRLWNSSSGVQEALLQREGSHVTAASISPDGTRIVGLRWDGSGALWDARTYRQIGELRGDGNVVHTAVFSRDGQRIVTAGTDKVAQLWDGHSGKALVRFEGHDAGIRAVAFSPDGKRVITGSDDKTVRIWDALTGLPIRVFVGHTNYLHTVAFSPDGNRILTASSDGTARLWDSAPDERDYAQIQQLMRCRVPFHLSGELIIPAKPDLTSCQNR